MIDTNKTKKRGTPLRLSRLLATAALTLSLALGSAVAATPAAAYTQYEQIVSSGHGYITPSYLVIHDTSNPGASARNHVNYWRNNQPNVCMAQYVMDLDGATVYHVQPDDTKAWQVGNGNSRVVGIELCYATSQADFDSQWREATQWAADYLKARGWGIDRLLSHWDCTRRWGGSDHNDPIPYFARYGRSWQDFRNCVAGYLNGGSGATTESTKPATPTPAADTSFAGSYTTMVDALNVRSGPGTGYARVAQYHRGQTVHLDGYVIRSGMVWGRYVAFSGTTRYVCVGRQTGGPATDDYLVKGGSVPSGGSSSGASYGAGYRTVTASAGLRVRTGAGTGHRVTGTLPKGYRLYLDGTTKRADGHTWARYMSYSGYYRWVATDWLS